MNILINGFILLFLLFLLIFLSMPVSIALGVVSVTGVLMIGGDVMTIIPQNIYSGINSFPLLAIPFFILAGELMNAGGITQKLINLASLMIGKMPASLAQVNIVTSMFFGGITGSATADTSAVGGMLIPAMKEEGYPADFSVAVTASSSTIGPIIPPSIIMVIYGTTVSTSVGALFMGGFVPGILVGLALMVVVGIMDRKYHYPRRTYHYTKEEAFTIMIEAVLPLLMPLIIMGGILSGIFTPTEAGAIAALYSFLLSAVIFHTVKIRDIPELLRKTAKVTAPVLFIIATSKILSWVFAVLRMQYELGEFLNSYVHSPFIFLIIVNILLLFMGTFMDAGASVIMMAPILAPIAIQYGINPVQFGLIMCINLTIGNATPPMGICLFIGSSIGKVQLSKVSKKILPFLIAEVIVLLMVTYIPDITLLLPRIFGLI